MLDVWLPADKIDDAARIPGVIATQLPDYPVTNAVTSAGDGILKADKVRSQFLGQGIDGTGIKIGVISDGVNHRANVVADLPSVTVDPSHAGNGDEGTAMLEIVHDLAPGAALLLRPGQQPADAGVHYYLKNQGCNVIVDDLSFFGEGYFTDTSDRERRAGRRQFWCRLRDFGGQLLGSAALPVDVRPRRFSDS